MLTEFIETADVFILKCTSPHIYYLLFKYNNCTVRSRTNNGWELGSYCHLRWASSQSRTWGTARGERGGVLSSIDYRYGHAAPLRVWCLGQVFWKRVYLGLFENSGKGFTWVYLGIQWVMFPEHKVFRTQYIFFAICVTFINLWLYKCSVCFYSKTAISIPSSSLFWEKDPNWVWSCGTQKFTNKCTQFAFHWIRI